MNSTTAYRNDHKWFLEDLQRATNSVLLLDCEVVAPVSSNRHASPSVPLLLHRIIKATGTRVILITSREVHEVAPLPGVVPPPEIWGACGLERLHPDGRYEEVAVAEGTLEALARAEDSLERAGLGELIQVGTVAVALDWKGLRQGDILAIRMEAYKILQPLLTEPGLILAESHGGMEIRLFSATKGNAVRLLLAELESHIPVAYLGHEVIDDDAFCALNGRGLTVVVNAKYRSTHAHVWLRPPDGLVRFLTEWISVAGDSL